MKRNMIYTVLAAMSMFALLIIILVTSIQIAIYGDSEYHFYQKEYEKYTVAKALDMKISDLMEVTEHMMAYLDGKEEKLSVEVPVEGKMQDFFNRQDREHMADVQVLFHKGRIVRRFATAVAAFLLAVLYVCKKYLKIKDRQTAGVQAKQWRLRPATRSVREYARTQFICLKGNFAARDIQMRCEVSGRADIIEQGVVG